MDGKCSIKNNQKRKIGLDKWGQLRNMEKIFIN
jgi:hypothetical protein